MSKKRAKKTKAVRKGGFCLGILLENRLQN